MDLLILDLMLPGMNGYIVCETLRGHGWDKPVLILSAARSRRSQTRLRCRGQPVHEQAVRPGRTDQPRAQSADPLPAADRRSARRSIAIEFGKAHVNFETFEATCDGAPDPHDPAGNEAPAVLHRA